MSKAAKKRVISKYTAKAKYVVKICFATSKECLEKNFGDEYAPIFTHQIFGVGEKLFGYKNPVIKIICNQTTGHCFVQFTYTNTVEDARKDLVADDMWAKLSVGLPRDYFRDYKAFIKAQRVKKYGIPKYEFTLNGKLYVAHLCDIEETNFKVVHKRFESLLPWFIEAASKINLNDKNWTIIYLYTYPNADSTQPALAGFCSLYNFKKRNNTTKSRISQFIIFPRYQRSGVGTVFLNCVYNIIRRTVNDLDEIVLEDPNNNFRVINTINNAATVFYCDEVMETLNAENHTHQGFVTAIRNTLKLNQQECEYIADVVIYLKSVIDENHRNQEIVIERVIERFANTWKKKTRYTRKLTPAQIKRKCNTYKKEFIELMEMIQPKVIAGIRVNKIRLRKRKWSSCV